MNSLAAYITSKRTDTKREFGGKKYAKRGELEEARLKKKQVAERTADEQKRVQLSSPIRCDVQDRCMCVSKKGSCACKHALWYVVCASFRHSKSEAWSANLAGSLQASNISAVWPVSGGMFQPDRALGRPLADVQQMQRHRLWAYLARVA